MDNNEKLVNSTIRNLYHSSINNNKNNLDFQQISSSSLNNTEVKLFNKLNKSELNNFIIFDNNKQNTANVTTTNTLPIDDQNIYPLFENNFIKTFQQFMKDYFSSSYNSTINDNETVNILSDNKNNEFVNDDDDEDFLNLASSGYGNVFDKSDEIFFPNNLTTKTTTTSLLTIPTGSNYIENFQIKNFTSINLNSTFITPSTTTSTSKIMSTIIPHYSRNNIVDNNNHQSSTMTPIQKLFDINKMIRTSHGLRPNFDSSTTIDVVTIDENSHNINNNNDDDLFFSQTLSSTTILPNWTDNNYYRPNFFQTSTTTTTTATELNNVFNRSSYNNNNNIFSFIGDPQCFHSPEDYELITSMLCSSLLVLGVVYFTYGYRCFRAFNFFVGFIFGAILFHTICTAENISIVPTLIPQHGNLIATLLTGFLVGLFTMLVAYLGLFIIGIHLGLMLAISLLIVIYILRPYYISLQAPLSTLTLLIFFVALSLVGSLTTVYFSKGGTIMASSMYGSALTLLCIDYFVEDFKVIHWFFDQLSSSMNNHKDNINNNGVNDNDIILLNNNFNLNNNNNINDWYGLLNNIKRSQKLCPISLIILILWPIFILFGLIIQCFCTARHYKYQNGYGIVDNNSGRGTPTILNHSRDSIRSLNHYHYPYPNLSTKLYNHNNNSINSARLNNNDRLSKNSMNAINLEEQRLEQKHRKYRYLYQVRTAHGDVISQHYLQSLQNNKKQNQQQQQLCLPDQDSFTFNSDLSSHFFPSESRTTTLSVA